MLPLALVILSYLLGSISSAVIVSRLFGLPDPRSQGSGNPGATNVLRLGGKKAAAITLLGDMLKGVIPVLVARAFESTDATVAACALAAFLGHLFPVFFRLRGGKGVATLFGALLALSWQAGLLTVATWLAVAAVTRISSLSALVAALFAPVYIAWRLPGEASLMAVIVMVSLLYWRHRSNIRKLLDGTEGRMGGGKDKT